MHPTNGLLLVVDDDPWTRYALANILKRKGWDTITAATVAEGLELVDCRPRCVVLDIGLPDGSGLAVLRKIREEGLPCRVVVCTVITDGGRLEGLNWLRPDAVLTKPVDADEILRACCRGAPDPSGAGRTEESTSRTTS
jgi:two-component system KDP operon response regulator KdpE